VSDKKKHRIQIFDSEGNFISTFGSYGDGIGQFKFPNAIYNDKNDNIYVCEIYNNRIQVFNSNGKFISVLETETCELKMNQFWDPVEIITNSKGNIIVNDRKNGRIVTFDSEGKFISQFGSKGEGNGELRSPSGICVDSNDNILVCDCDNNRIQIFNSNGEYIAQFHVKYPKGIAIDPKTQNIIVCGSDYISMF